MDKDLEKKEKLEKALTDKDFLSDIFQTKDDEEIINKFKSKGVEITKEDCAGIKEEVDKISKELEKLDDETLKELSGGYLSWNPVNWFKSKSPAQKLKDGCRKTVGTYSEALVEAVNDPETVGDFVTAVGTGFKSLANIAKNKTSEPQYAPTPRPVVEAPAKESGNSQFMMGAVTTAAVAAAAGLVYANRKKLKKVWHNYMG